MFELITLNDLILIKASELKNQQDNLMNKIKQKFEYKPLKDYGFCLKVIKIHSSEGQIEDGDVLFSVIIEILSIQFIQNELYYGEIISSNQEGLEIKFLNVQNDKQKQIIAFIPGNLLLNAKYNGKIWIAQWQKTEFYYTQGEQIKFKINSLKWDSANNQNEIIEGKMNEPGLGGVNWWI